MINFSKYKLQVEGQAASGGTQSSLDASTKSAEAATMGRDKAQGDKQMGSERQRRQRAQKADPRGVGQVFEDMQRKVEQIKAYESQKSDWRQELNEKVVDGQEREQHPYVTVMPTGDENLINAVKQMGKGVKAKKDAVSENYSTAQMQKTSMDDDSELDDSEADKQKKKAKKAKMVKEDKESDKDDSEYKRKGREYKKNYEDKKKSSKKAKEYNDSRLRKIKSGDLKGAQRDKDRANEYADKVRNAEAKNAPMDPIGSSKYSDKRDPTRSNDTFKKDIKTDEGAAEIVKSGLRKKVTEGMEIEDLIEAKKKKKCKEGYKRDENGNCVKKSKSRTTVVYGGRYPWMGGGHHDHDEDDDSNGDGGGGDAGGGEGGGMGEMFDVLGDMLLKEKLESGPEYHARMRDKNKSPINPYAVAKKKQAEKVRNSADTRPNIKVTGTMTDAVGKPRMGSSD